MEKFILDNLIFEHEISFSGWLWKVSILCEKCNTYYDAGYVTSPEKVYEKTIEKHDNCKGKFKCYRIKK